MIGRVHGRRDTIHTGDCLEWLKTLPDDCVDACVTDPPYGTRFMNKKWDMTGITYRVDLWEEVLRVLKPGAHLLAFGGTRTYHRLACAIEDAGFEIRDQVQWIYGSGFPKSLNISKAIDKAVKVKRKQWNGWGTALKPAHESICLARVPLSEKTVAANVLKHKTGGVNINACRIGTDVVTINTWDDGAKPFGGGAGHKYTGRQSQGRYPTNLVHDGSEEVIKSFPKTKAQFFYCAKASKAERDAGCEGIEEKPNDSYNEFAGTPEHGPKRNVKKHNCHPTVKPLALMRWLCRLVTPPGGMILDPFAGSGTTLIAAMQEDFHYLGCELVPEYTEIAKARIREVIGERTNEVAT